MSVRDEALCHRAGQAGHPGEVHELRELPLDPGVGAPFPYDHQWPPGLEQQGGGLGDLSLVCRESEDVLRDWSDALEVRLVHVVPLGGLEENIGRNVDIDPSRPAR